jgi:hypothetical protein
MKKNYVGFIFLSLQDVYFLIPLLFDFPSELTYGVLNFMEESLSREAFGRSVD